MLLKLYKQYTNKYIYLCYLHPPHLLELFCEPLVLFHLLVFLLPKVPHVKSTQNLFL